MVIAISAVAYALADMVHEALGSPLQRDVDYLRRDHRRGVCADSLSGTSFVGFLT